MLILDPLQNLAAKPVAMPMENAVPTTWTPNRIHGWFRFHMNASDPDSTPDHPPSPPEMPQPDLPPGVPSPAPEQVPDPGEPLGVPPTGPVEVPTPPPPSPQPFA